MAQLGQACGAFADRHNDRFSANTQAIFDLPTS